MRSKLSPGMQLEPRSGGNQSTHFRHCETVESCQTRRKRGECCHRSNGLHSGSWETASMKRSTCGHYPCCAKPRILAFPPTKCECHELQHPSIGSMHGQNEYLEERSLTSVNHPRRSRVAHGHPPTTNPVNSPCKIEGVEKDLSPTNSVGTRYHRRKRKPHLCDR